MHGYTSKTGKNVKESFITLTKIMLDKIITNKKIQSILA